MKVPCTSVVLWHLVLLSCVPIAVTLQGLPGTTPKWGNALCTGTPGLESAWLIDPTGMVDKDLQRVLCTPALNISRNTMLIQSVAVAATGSVLKMPGG